MRGAVRAELGVMADVHINVPEATVVEGAHEMGRGGVGCGRGPCSRLSTC